MGKWWKTAAALSVLTAGFAVNGTASAEPALLKAVPPDYPRAAERREIEGYVIVSIDVDAEGKVTAVSVVESDNPGIFDSAAVRAVERWKFEAGQAASGITKKLQFRLEA
ncbi:MAG: energy transducer TonB [Pseudomonadota bacterium]